MTATKLFMNWTGVQFSYGTLPTVIPIAQVRRIRPVRNANQKVWSSDAAAFATLILMKDLERGVTVTSGDVGTLMTIPDNTPGTFVAVLNDAKNGVGAGAMTITLANAVYKGTDGQAEHNEFGLADATFMAFSTDGTTDPLTVTFA